MAAYSPRLSRPEQYQKIMECRSSGLSDQQWCIAHGINPGIFYNWVSRLRKSGDFEIPDSTCAESFAPSEKQDVVKLEIIDDLAPVAPPYMVPDHEIVTEAPISVPTHTIELSIGKLVIKASNDVNPILLTTILSQLGGAL